MLSDRFILESVIQPYFKAGTRLLSAQPLGGGSSALSYKLELLEANSQPQTLLMRCFPKQSLARVQQEFELMRRVAASSAWVSLPLACAQASDGQQMIPFLLLPYLAGQSRLDFADLAGALRQAAKALADIHRL